MCYNMCILRNLSVKVRCREYCVKRFKHSSLKTQQKKEEKKYTYTINLPKTHFPLWLRGIKRVEQDEQILKGRGFSSLYEWQRNNVKGPEFVLHDGPPYANGIPHMGHAINKVLKDITTRHKLLQGHKVHYVPGWDCHGLPIEMKAMAGVDATNISPISIRKKARTFAKEAAAIQRDVFKSWGVMADWQNDCYYTYDKKYIQNQLRQFYKLFSKGLIYRDLKPVYWSPSSRTALAEAELEYKEDHKSVAVILRLQLTTVPSSWNINVTTPVYALIWTTTPWTLPANRAISYNSSLQYCLVSINNSQDLYLVASDLVEDLHAKLGKSIYVVKSIEGSSLQDAKYNHPMEQNNSLPFLAASYVSATKGTGLVHTAPAHGPDDFLLAKQNNINVDCLVDENGCYTDRVAKSLIGLPVLTTGCGEVLSFMESNKSIIHREMYKHSYPYDWRTKQPVILRASQQWFIDTDTIKSKAIEALKDVKILPDRGTAGLISQLERRPYWCISRQRVWGVPIPMLYNKNNNQHIISKSLIEHYCSLLEEVGEDFWWSCSLEELVPNSICTELQLSVDDLEKGQDILDIWLDSGLSWSCVLDKVADVYLEGVDQFTGWFQSSLMTSVALRDIAPYRKVFVHGFAVDEQGCKMSKSVGNVVNPQEIIRGGLDEKKQPPYGVDTLRWWVASHATQHTNVPISIPLLDSCGESVHKFRSVLKFLLGAIFDIKMIEKQPQLRILDKYLLHSLFHLNKEVVEMYENFQYNRVCNALTNFVTNEVSGLYCHVTKDRLYCDEKDSDSRRAVQVTMHNILEVMSRLMAPILPVLAEEIYMYHPEKQGSELLFHKTDIKCHEEWDAPDVARIIELALLVKKDISKSIPLNCSNFEMKATVSAPLQTYQTLKLLQEDEESCSSELVEILQVASVSLHHNEEISSQFVVKVDNTNGTLCKRCRCRTVDLDELCSRCCQVLESLAKS